MTIEMWTILLAAAVAVAATLLFRRGARRHPRARGKDADRVRTEDALKHLHDCEERHVSCTRESIAGAIGEGEDAAAHLLGRLAALGLVETRDGVFTLSDPGRAYALRVIRTHRLWERYLAEETGVPETSWHRSAEEAEHRLSSEQAERLAARMGNPRYDPHGDPIPTEEGELPGPRGVPLTRLAAGEIAAVVHIEDQPAQVYAELVAHGFHPGTRLRVLETAHSEMRLEADGRTVTLRVLVAANITVSRLPAESPLPRAETTLDRLTVGEQARVASLSPACRGMQRRRLMDMGVVPGSVIRAEFRSPAGDPTAYRIRGAVVALRADHARLILVDRVREGA